MVLPETYPTITPAFGHRFIIDGKDTVTLNRGGAFVKRPKRGKGGSWIYILPGSNTFGRR